MTTLDFPVAPLVGDRFPTPSVAGMPQYIWDGEKWTTATNTITTAPPSTSLPLEDNATASIGVTTKYAREDHVHPSTALKYSAQTLTSAQAAQSRTNLYSAPFDALAYSGMQINGSMEVSQERAVNTPIANDAYICDGWRWTRAGSNSVNAFCYQAAATFAGFQNYIQASVITAQPSLGANDGVCFYQPFEGFRISRLMWGTPSAVPLTIGFWVSHGRAGLYGGCILGGGGLAYAFSYTQNISGAKEYKTVTIAGPTTGTWKADNTLGFHVLFSMAAGTTYLAPSTGTWLSGNYWGVVGQVNAIASTSDYFRITGVVVLPGIEAPSAERSPLIMRPYDQELLTCQRYWRRIKTIMHTAYGGTGSGYDFFTSYSTMRAIPTATTSGTFALTNCSTPSFSQVSESNCTIRVTVTTTGVFQWYPNPDGAFNLDARL